MASKIDMATEMENRISQMLSANSFSIGLGSAAQRADGAQLDSNSPCEDCYNCAQPFIPWENEEWIAATVFDGHNGRQTAAHLERNLLHAVQSSLEQLDLEARDDDQKIQKAIEESFVALDKTIIDTFSKFARDDTRSLADTVPQMQVAMAGSCALLVLYNPIKKIIYTACTGDSRAVLAKQKVNLDWEADLLSEDQNGWNADEVSRIKSEHPGENIVVEDGRVLGLAVTRAFGNYQWKSTYEDQFKLGRKFASFGPKKEAEIPTPPYLTAKPVVTVTKLDNDQRCFIVLATDGLWNNVSSTESVDLVVQWLEARQARSISTGPIISKVKETPESIWWKKDPQEYTYEPGFHWELRWHEFDDRFLYERTVLKDLDNAAVHLLRNCFGGAHEDLLRARLAYEPPLARNVRDDTTVQVIFL